VTEFVRTAAHYIALAAEAIAALVVLVGTLQALWIYLTRALPQRCPHFEMIRSRVKLGHALSLGLEFLIGADILKTAIAPSWDDLGQLGAIVAIRIALNFFLMRELDHEDKVVAAAAREAPQARH
jgi:uncharacterized membrane protein